MLVSEAEIMPGANSPPPCPGGRGKHLLGIIFHMMKDRIAYQEFLKRGGNAQ